MHDINMVPDVFVIENHQSHDMEPEERKWMVEQMYAQMGKKVAEIMKANPDQALLIRPTGVRKSKSNEWTDTYTVELDVWGAKEGHWRFLNNIMRLIRVGGPL
jgi:hypothetical protein